MSTNGHIFRYFIKLLVRGFEKPFVYSVGMEEFDRLRSLLADLPQPHAEKKLPNLFIFNTTDNLVIGVSPVEIQLAHFLVERSSDQHLNYEGEDLDPERSDIHLYFRGKMEPYKVSVAESGDAAALYFQLETGTFEAGEFYSFLDVDGEEVAVCLKDVLVVEFRKDVLDEGTAESGEDAAELDEF